MKLFVTRPQSRCAFLMWFSIRTTKDFSRWHGLRTQNPFVRLDSDEYVSGVRSQDCICIHKYDNGRFAVRGVSWFWDVRMGYCWACRQRACINASVTMKYIGWCISLFLIQRYNLFNIIQQTIQFSPVIIPTIKSMAFGSWSRLLPFKLIAFGKGMNKW